MFDQSLQIFFLCTDCSAGSARRSRVRFERAKGEINKTLALEFGVCKRTRCGRRQHCPGVPARRGPLFLVKRIEILISSGSASFEGKRARGLSYRQSHFLPRTYQDKYTASTLPSVAVHPSENISNEQTIRFDTRATLTHMHTQSHTVTLIHHPSASASRLRCYHSRERRLHSSITNLNFATIYLLYAAPRFHWDSSRSLPVLLPS